MKITLTLESEDMEEVRQHTTVGELRAAIWEFDQDLRAVVKYGGTNCGSLKLSETGEEAEYYEKVRAHLHKVLNDYNVSDILL